MKVKVEKRDPAWHVGTPRDEIAVSVRTGRPLRAVPPERPDRRQNILDASQRLFASVGYHAVTIRQIAAAANVPLALVGYYFGLKQQLYDAVFEHWIGLSAQHSADLRAAVANSAGDRLQGIVAALVSPMVRIRADVAGETYALFVAQGLTHQGAEEDRAIREHFDPLATEFIDALHHELVKTHPRFTRAQAAWGFQFALGALLHHMSDRRVARLSKGKNVPGGPMVEPELIAFIAHGLRGLAASFSEGAASSV
jgi:AcrR family transcriptional regulator